jgi:hypothetical protein
MQCYTESLFFFPVSISSSCEWLLNNMSSSSKRAQHGYWGPAKYLNWLLILIVTKRVYQTTSVQLREVLTVCQGCQPQPWQQTSSHKSSSSVSSSASDEDDESGPGEQIQQAVTLLWTSPSCTESSVAHTFTWAPRGKNDNEESHKRRPKST